MIEALTSDEIIASSKKWQSKISVGTNFSRRELFDIGTDVMRIRASVGLASSVNSSAIIDNDRLRFILVAGSEADEKCLDIMVLPRKKNYYDLSEGYHLVEKRDSSVAMLYSAGFRSLFDDGKRTFVPGQITRDNYDPFAFVYNQQMLLLARTLWNTHQKDAPLKKEYLTPETPAATA